MANPIKIHAPSTSPHICYIPAEYGTKIEFLKKHFGKSLYSILCLCAGTPLDTKEHIKQFKTRVRHNGFKNIGEWASEVVRTLYTGVKDGEAPALCPEIIPLEEEEK